MVVRTLLKIWLLVREWNKGDNSNLVSVVAYLDTGKYPAWICGFVTHPHKLESKLGSSAWKGPRWAGGVLQSKTMVAHTCDVWEDGACWYSWLG
jgi:hypothetical protein